MGVLCDYRIDMRHNLASECITGLTFDHRGFLYSLKYLLAAKFFSKASSVFMFPLYSLSVFFASMNNHFLCSVKKSPNRHNIRVRVVGRKLHRLSPSNPRKTLFGTSIFSYPSKTAIIPNRDCGAFYHP